MRARTHLFLYGSIPWRMAYAVALALAAVPLTPILL
jgi:hypothetical protein